MAMGNNPSHVRISLEFGDATRPSPPSMSNLYNQIFDTSAGTHSKFAGYGKPSVTNLEAEKRDTDGGGWVDLTFTVNNNKDLPTRVQIEFHETDGNPPFTGQTTGLGSSVETYQSSGSKSLTFQVSEADTEYAFRARNFNGFNEEFPDHGFSNSDTAVTSSGDTSGGDQPSDVKNLVRIMDLGSGVMDFSFEYKTSGHTGFLVQHSWDGGSWISGNMTLLSSSGTDYEGRFSPDNLDSGSKIQYRIRGDSSEAWAYTNTYDV